MSHSAPQSHPLDFEIENLSIPSATVQHYALDLSGGDSVLPREVQRTISLTSENPSEMFFSAEEDISNMMSQRSSLRTQNGSIILSGKKRFSSDLRFDFICVIHQIRL